MVSMLWYVDGVRVFMNTVDCGEGGCGMYVCGVRIS